MKLNHSYDEFWGNAFALTIAEFQSSDPRVVTTGRYIERHGENYIFFCSDLRNGKNILALGPTTRNNFETDSSLLPKVAEADFGNIAELSKLHLEFTDLDFTLPSGAQLPAMPLSSFKTKLLKVNDQSAIDKFHSSLSEDDQDTLNLKLAEDTAVGALDADGNVLGIARFCPIPGAPSVADITVAVTSSARGQGLASMLVADVIRSALKQGLTVKYRVAEDNRHSRAIAEKLGLIATHKLITWSTKGDEK